MRYHLIGMHPCIGSTREGQSYRRTQDRGEGLLHLCLHRVSIRLRLRTMEIRSAICKGDKVTHCDV
jgi:hypothetical protein